MKYSKAGSATTFRSVATFACFLVASSLILSCATRSADGGGHRSSRVPEEVSLKADRSAFDDERKEIPEERRRENDELALVLQMLTEKSNQEPGAIREKFNKATRDKREKSDKILRKRRDEFTKVEKSVRDTFLKRAKDDRDKYMAGKHSSDDRKRFFDEQDDQRKEFFANEADKRKDFESEMTEARKAFEDYMKEKADQFNDEIRAYTTDFYERKKNEALQKDSKLKMKTREAGEPSRVQNEFDSIPGGPGIPLGAPSGGH